MGCLGVGGVPALSLCGPEREGDQDRLSWAPMPRNASTFG